MEKREAELKSAFVAELKRQAPGYLILEYATNGAPDREIVGGGITTRWEMKHATPDFDSPGLQELTCMRLAAAGHCRYIIWQETAHGTRQRTMIVHPRKVYERNGWLMDPETWCIGYDMNWLVEQVVKAHTR